jgi:hypothetical protein
MDSTSNLSGRSSEHRQECLCHQKLGGVFFCGEGGWVHGVRLTGLNSTVAAMDGLYFEFEWEVVRAQAGVPVPLKTGRQSAAL